MHFDKLRHCLVIALIALQPIVSKYIKKDPFHINEPKLVTLGVANENIIASDVVDGSAFPS